jgi:hypothetical protein
LELQGACFAKKQVLAMFHRLVDGYKKQNACTEGGADVAEGGGGRGGT